VSFSAALKDLNARQDKYVINFVYDELEDFKVTKNIKNESVPDAIMNLIGFYPIKMKQVDNVIIVECIQKTSNRMMGRIVDTHHQPAENDTLLYCRVMRWAETPILITESKIKLIRYLLIAYSLFLQSILYIQLRESKN